MKGLTFKQWFAKRFVVISEIIGYTISIAVGIGVVYSLFVRVEVTARVEGDLHPARTEAAARTDALLIDYMVSTGQEVKQGQPILHAALDDASQRRVQTRRRLEAAVALLEAHPDGDAPAALEETRRAIGALPPPETGEIIPSPTDGLFKELVEPGQEELTPAGKPLAFVYDMSQLRFDGPLGASATDQKAAEGQTARTTMPGIPAPILGRVEAVNTSATPKTVSIRFDGISPEVRDYFYARVFGQEQPSSSSAHADLVVGYQSLFKQIFGRKR